MVERGKSRGWLGSSEQLIHLSDVFQNRNQANHHANDAKHSAEYERDKPELRWSDLCILMLTNMRGRTTFRDRKFFFTEESGEEYVLPFQPVERIAKVPQ